MFEALLARNSELETLAARQEALIAELHHALHGKRSEKLDPDERQLQFEDLEVAIASVERAQEAASATPPASRKKAKPPFHRLQASDCRAVVNRNLGNLPDHLPRIERIFEPDSLDCPHGCGPLHRIGEDRIERVAVRRGNAPPGPFLIRLTTRPSSGHHNRPTQVKA